MRKVAIIVAIIFCIPYLADAKNMRREYGKMIRKYDIDIAAKEADNIGEFWDMVWKTNSRYMKFYKACQKERPTAKRTFREYSKAYYLTEMYEESLTVISGLDSLLADIKEDIGLSFQDNQPKFYIVDNPQFNAFSYPDGNIYIQSGILDVNGLTYWGLVGICVHEYAHYLLQHALAGQYYAIRREKASMAVAGIAAGLNTGVAAYASANGSRVDWDAVNLTNIGLFDAALLTTEILTYKYTREQEIEADIIAYRFLEYTGVGGDYYIEALELMPEVSYYVYDSDHPSNRYRIALLRYMKGHPEIVKETSQNF